MILRSVLVYVFLVVVLRLSGKRLLAQLSPFDFVVILILSNTLQNAILGEDNTVAGGIVRAVSLLALNWTFVRFDVWLNEAVDRNRRRADDGSAARGGVFRLLERIVDGSADRLIVNGAVFHQVRRKEGITGNQLRAALHRQGIRSVKDVARAELDPGRRAVRGTKGSDAGHGVARGPDRAAEQDRAAAHRSATVSRCRAACAGLVD